MTLYSGSLIEKIKVKCEHKVIHDLFSKRPDHIPTICPLSIQTVTLDEGEWGTPGSVITWTYFHDGHKRTAKEIVEEINDNSVKFKVIGGDLTELYSYFTLHIEGETIGEDHFVTWTLCYKKLKEDVPYPTTLMDFCIGVTKDIEKHHHF